MDMKSLASCKAEKYYHQDLVPAYQIEEIFRLTNITCNQALHNSHNFKEM